MPTSTGSYDWQAAARERETQLGRIRSEFAEMPGLTLTAWQASRLFGIEPIACESALGSLVAFGFLRRTASGQYCCAHAQ
jgi:hypothetical protein